MALNRFTFFPVVRNPSILQKILAVDDSDCGQIYLTLLF